MWLFTELRMPQLRAIAAADAARADLVIISVHHAESLPEEVTGWVEAWLQQKGSRTIALLALFDPLYKGDSSSMKTFLQDAAKKAKMEFLVQSEEMLDDR
jgi:hypothetical protein